MLDPALAFSLAGLLAMAGWLALALSLVREGGAPDRLDGGAADRCRRSSRSLTACSSGAAAAPSRERRLRLDRGGPRALRERRALAAGWLHYLAFDLFVGAFIARDGLERGVPALLILLCLPLTLLFGPLGLLLYLILRLALGRRTEPETI